MPNRERSRGRGLHLFALSALAIAQPLFDLLAHNAGFLVAHHLTPNEILGLVALLLLAPPVAAWTLEAAASRIDPRAGWILHLGLVAAFAALALLPAIARVELLPGVAGLCLAVAAGAAVALAYTKFRALRRFVSALALGAPIFAIVFLASDPIATLLETPKTELSDTIAFEAEAPIVMVFFDELPLVSLLDADEQIDARRYPAFARLAHAASWYRNATSVHAQTHLALPAMLTGRYSPPTFVPVAAAHPNNFFTLIADAYEMNVHEMETSLLPADRNDRDAIEIAALPRVDDFFSDLFILALHRGLPDDLTRGLPVINDTWRDFAHGDARDRPAPGPYQVRDKRFRQFIASIEPSERPALHFFHALIPHTPLNFLPSGRRYFPVDNFGQTKRTWGDEPWWVTQAWQRHLLQVQFVDRLLGELLDHLQETGLYDPALIVISADHGGGFWPGEVRRNPVLSEHPEDVMRIPLFIKAPRQRAGRLIDRNVETIDLLPTIAEHLGIEIPWQTHGCSALASDCPERSEKTFVTSLGERKQFAIESILDRATLDHKLEIFGPGPDLHRIGTHRALIGRPIAELTIREEPKVTAVLRPAPFEMAAKRPSFTLARITGHLLDVAPQQSPHVAIAVNGVILAVAPALPHSGPGPLFSAMIPETLAPTNATEIDLLLVTGEPPHPQLQRIPTRIGSQP